jgi:hypothetical protein
MFSLIAAVILPVGIIAFAVWLALRARRGRISATTTLGANDALFNRDQRRAAEVIVNRNAGKKMKTQDTSGSDRPGSQ